MCKTVGNVLEAIVGIKSGATIMIGGFGVCGVPENCIRALATTDVKDLICISNSGGLEDYGVGLLLKENKIKKIICSYAGDNADFEQQILNGSIEVKLIPQGTLAMCCMLPYYSIAAAYFPAGIGTEVAQGKEIREIGGVNYLLEESFNADYALIKAWRGDEEGNLVFRGTARNFNYPMALGAKITIAEVEELIDGNGLEEDAHIEGCNVQMIFKGEKFEHRILHLKTIKKGVTSSVNLRQQN